MAKRKKKGEPEMLIVSFCDIVTITTAAMFFAMLITVQEAVKVPVIKPVPRAQLTGKQALFFECRNNEVFYIDKEGLDVQVKKLLETLSPNVKSGDLGGFMKAISGYEVGNKYYKVNPSYLLAAVLALDPRPGVHGDDPQHVNDPAGQFSTAIAKLDPHTQYIAFLVRDDSFPVFREARCLASKDNFDVGWELLGQDEPIKFGAGGAQILSQ